MSFDYWKLEARKRVLNKIRQDKKDKSLLLSDEQCAIVDFFSAEIFYQRMEIELLKAKLQRHKDRIDDLVWIDTEARENPEADGVREKTDEDEDAELDK